MDEVLLRDNAINQGMVLTLFSSDSVR